MKTLSRSLSVLGAAALALAGCSSGTQGSASASSSSAAGSVSVAASFYPIAWLTQQLGGDAVSVDIVTPANVEPHDFELAPADITKLEKTSAIIYVAGFQPSLDDAVATISGPTIVDLSDAVDLVPLSEDTENAEGSSESEDEHGTYDPHFWLDPVRMSDAATAVAAALEKLAPDDADTIKVNLATVTKELQSLDSSYTTGLQGCERTTIVTSHAAFGYLSMRYGLTQVSISGIDPESEPSPADLAAVKKVIQETGTTTVFTEALVSPKTAEAVADEAGATTEVLNPIESEPDGGDYVSAMKDNLAALQTALGCPAS
ncbi:MAG: metal ABC transporter substrate-binding protein [Ancrocorticia sp.]|nr:metal ABC transporter substrate-binding protein [Ancrocorticia sp.]